MNRSSFHSKQKPSEDPYKKRKRLEEALKNKKLILKQEFANLQNKKIAKNELIIPLNEIRVP